MLCSNNNKEKNRPSLPHNTHILYTDEEPPKQKREIGTTNKILESIARRGTTQYMRHLNKHCCLENLGKVDVGRLRMRHLILSSIVSINRHKEEPFMQFQVRIKPIFTNSGVKYCQSTTTSTGFVLVLVLV